MNELQTILDHLEHDEELYVLEMSKNPNDSIKNVLKRIGISKATFYTSYDKQRRDELDELARRINRNVHFRALKKADEHSIAAMNKLVQLMHHANSEYVQLQAAQEILNRALGASTQRFEAKVEVTDWRKELQDNGIDDGSLFNELVAAIANQQNGT